MEDLSLLVSIIFVIIVQILIDIFAITNQISKIVKTARPGSNLIGLAI